MTYFLICLALIGALYFFSYTITQLFSRVIFSILNNRPVTISLLSLLLYPGVVIHELSHLLTAVVLFVPVKSMSLVPQMADKTTLQGGSVTIAKVDPVRRTLVGIAPLFAGIAALWFVSVYLLPPVPFICTETSSLQASSVVPFFHNDVFCNNKQIEFMQHAPYPILYTIFALYLIFSISGTMYSSKKDLEALIITIPVLLIITAIAYILGFQFVWIVGILNGFEVFFQKLSSVLLIPLSIQVVLFILLRIIRSVLSIKR